MDDKQSGQRDFPALDSLYLEFKNLLRKMEPPVDVGEHFRNARLEVLKGFRSIIDSRIEQIERKDQHGQKINVE